VGRRRPPHCAGSGQVNVGIVIVVIVVVVIVLIVLTIVDIVVVVVIIVFIVVVLFHHLYCWRRQQKTDIIYTH
jgi:hypothetical protein